MPIKTVEYVDQPFAMKRFVPDTSRLGALMTQGAGRIAEIDLQKGANATRLFDTLGNIWTGYQQQQAQAKALKATLAVREKEHADDLSEKEKERAERKAERDDAARIRKEDQEHADVKDWADNKIAAGVVPDTPQNRVMLQIASKYPDVAARFNKQQTLPARPVDPSMGPMAAPEPMVTREATGPEMERAGATQRSIEAAKLMEDNRVRDDARATAAAGRQEAFQKRSLDIQQQNANRLTTSAASPDGVGNVALSQDAVEEAAHRVRLYGPASIPTRFNEGDKKRILNRSAEINKAMGTSPVAAVLKQAVQKSDQKSLDLVTKMGASVGVFENKANAQADLVNQLSSKVGRTDYPIINGVLVSGKAAMGDTPAHLLGNALLTFTAEYAKIMEGSTGSAAASSDASRRAAAELISTALSKGTLAATVDQMKREMRMTTDAIRVGQDEITARMSGQAATPSVAAPGGVKVLSITPVKPQ